MNKILLIGLVILMLPLVFGADNCFMTEPCTFYVYNAEGELGVNITFYYPNETEIGTFPMIQLDVGKYLYNMSFSNIGNIMSCAKAYNSTGYFAETCESKLIELRPSNIGGNASMSLSPLFMILGVGLVAALLLIIAFKLDKSHIYWKLFILAIL